MPICFSISTGLSYALVGHGQKCFLTICFAAILLTGCKTLKPGNHRDATAPHAALNLDPGPDNPRNSEGDFITLKNGQILFVYSHFTGASGSDFAHAYLASRYSKDGGRTWSQTDKVEINAEGMMNVMSVSLLRLQDGQIALFYVRKNSEEDCIPMMRISSDEAKSWGPAIPCITDRKGYFVLNNSRVIQLKSGRILLPVALHKVPGDAKWSESGKLFCYYSDDNGNTWKASEEVSNPGHVLTQEPGVVELNNDAILMFIRTNAGVQYFSNSKDGGQTWTAIYPSSLASPVSPASIKRIPATGDLLVAWNNNDGSDPAIKGKRTPFTVSVSRDNGKTWKHYKTIEDNPKGWYCYTAIHFIGNEVLLGYCAGDQTTSNGLARTRITRIGLDWIYQ